MHGLSGVFYLPLYNVDPVSFREETFAAARTGSICGMSLKWRTPVGFQPPRAKAQLRHSSSVSCAISCQIGAPCQIGALSSDSHSHGSPTVFYFSTPFLVLPSYPPGCCFFLAQAYCSCSTLYSPDSPNTNICPVCLGEPGSLPVPNARVVELSAKAGMALGCNIAAETKWDRKVLAICRHLVTSLA